MDIIGALVRNVLKTEYADLPREAIDRAKLVILDTIGCMIGGATAPGCESLRNQVVAWGGKKESTIMVFGDKVPCPNAALVNSTMARALEFDSTWERGLHMSAASVPTALAVAEACGDISGKEFLTTLVAGEDLAARINLATSNYDGFEPTGVCGILGLAAITGKMLALDEKGMLDALGIALNRAAGSFQPNIDGALVARVMEGLASRSGIESALLAQRGISGGENILEGVYGYFHLFSDDKYQLERLTDKLGEEFLGGPETQFKKYPAGGITASAIEATLELINAHDIRPEAVDEITVESNKFFNSVAGNPFKIRANPQVDAQFSYQYTVANALVRRRFSIEDILPEAVKDAEVLGMVEKVYPKTNENLVKEGIGATVVRILTKEGKQYARQINHRKGSRHNPMSRKEIIEKFRLCAAFGERPISGGNAEQIINVIDKLENIGNVNELIDLICDKTNLS